MSNVGGDGKVLEQAGRRFDSLPEFVAFEQLHHLVCLLPCVLLLPSCRSQLLLLEASEVLELLPEDLETLGGGIVGGPSGDDRADEDVDRETEGSTPSTEQSVRAGVIAEVLDDELLALRGLAELV